MDRKDQKSNPINKEMRAKLSIDEGFAEKPIYRIVAKITEKEKGIGMMDLIQKMFNISEWQRKNFIRKTIKDLRDKKLFAKDPIKWTRDNEGNIISPFASKTKLNH